MAHKSKKPEKTMQQAVQALFDLACSEASSEQMLEIAHKFGVEVHALEGFYFKYVESLDESWAPIA